MGWFLNNFIFELTWNCLFGFVSAWRKWSERVFLFCRSLFLFLIMY